MDRLLYSGVFAGRTLPRRGLMILATSCFVTEVGPVFLLRVVLF